MCHYEDINDIDTDFVYKNKNQDFFQAKVINMRINKNYLDNDKISYFKRTIKRDKSQYNILCDKKQWDSWNWLTKVTSQCYQYEEVFNKVYAPNGSGEKELFLEKQMLMYAIFDEKLQTGMGSHLVRKYEKTYDAQNGYAELLAYAKESTHATIESSNILS